MEEQEYVEFVITKEVMSIGTKNMEKRKVHVRKPLDPNLSHRAAKALAQGETGTNSKRASAYVQGVYPTHLVKGEGVYVWDASGNRYVDFICGLGTNLLGMNHPKVTEAAIKQCKEGVSFSLPTHLEVEVAEMIQEMVPCAERIRFLKTGNEATLAAATIARASSGKSNIESDGFHGHGNLWTSLMKPALGVVGDFFIRAFGHEPHHDISIHEPIMTDASDMRKITYKRIRESTDLLISDEVVTGFRVPHYTVATWWDIRPDLICLGKAIANGYPLSVVAGREEVMNCGEYFVSSTFSGEAVSLAAAKATLTELKKINMQGYYEHANRFQEKFNEITKPLHIKIEGYGTRGMLSFDTQTQALLGQEMCKAGILIGKGYFYSIAMMEAELDDFVLNVLSDVVGKISRGQVRLEGKPPSFSFKR